MLKSFRFSFRQLMLICCVLSLLSFTSSWGQSINTGNLKEYGLFAGSQVNVYSTISIDGKIGATGSNNPSFISASEGAEFNTTTFDSVLIELDTLINQFNGFSYTTVSINSSGQNNFSAGKYKHTGNLTLNDIIHFSGSAGDEIIIYIDGSLILDSGCGFDLAGILPENIYVFASGGITVKNNSVTYGTLISQGIISFENNTAGKFCIFSRSNIEHINISACFTQLSFYSGLSLHNLPQNQLRQGGIGECENVSTIGSTLDDYAIDITVGNNGEYFVTGRFSGTCTFFTSSGNSTLSAPSAYDMFVCKYNPDGSIQWIRQGNLLTAGNSIGTCIDFNDFGGNEVIYIGGYFTGLADFSTGTNYDATNGGAFILKLDAATGNVIWVKQEGDSDTWILAICTDSNTGEIYAGGRALGSTTYSNNVTVSASAWVAKYDALSNFIWFIFGDGLIRNIEISKHPLDSKVAILYELDFGQTGFFGCTNPSATDPNPCLTVVDKVFGSPQWNVSLAGGAGNPPSATYNVARGLALSNSNPSDVYVTGNCMANSLFSFPAVMGGGYLLKLNPNGSYNSSTQIPVVAQAFEDVWHDIGLDPNGDVYLIGYGNYPPFTFNNITYNQPPLNSGFILRYSPTLNLKNFIDIPSHMLVTNNLCQDIEIMKSAIEVDNCRIYTSFSFKTIPATIDGVDYYSQGVADGLVATLANPDDIAITTPGPTQFCQGGSVLLDAGIHSSYQWFLNGVAIPGATSQTYSATQTGYYSVEAATGCCSEATATIYVNVLPAPNPNAGSDITTCEGYTEQLQATGAPNPVWSPAANLSNPFIANPVFTAPSAGTYTYTLTSTGSNGCSATDQITITVNPSPVADAGIDPEPLCVNDPAAGVLLSGSGGISCSWLPATGLSNPSVCNPVASPSVTTVYTLTVTAANGCTDTDDITVSVDQNCCAGNTYLYSGNYSADIISALPVSVNGTINITGTMMIDCPDMRMSPGSSIVVSSGTLTIIHSWLHPCNNMWKGIIVLPGASLVINDYSRIEGAFKAVHSIGGGNFDLDDVLFNQNQEDIHIDPFAAAHPGSVEHCVFTCRDLSSLNPYTQAGTNLFIQLAVNLPFYLDNNFSTTTLPPPLSAIRSQKALYVTGNTNVNFGVPVNGRRNLVDYHDYGVYAINTSVTVLNNRFTNITGHGLVKPALGIAVYAENNILNFSNPATHTSLRVGGNGNNEPNFFRDCYAGVFSLETPYIDIQNNTFNNQVTNPAPVTGARGLYGVFTRLRFYSFYEVNNNIVNNCETGIHFLRNSKGESFPQDANLLSNRIFGGNLTNLYCNTGILIEDVVLTDLQNQINVSSNRINNAAVGIHGRNVNQVLHIFENDNIDIKPGVTTLSYHAGIRAENCGNLRIIKNEKIKSNNNTDVKIKGIYLTKNNQKPVVVCNKVRQVGQGIVFEGNNGFAFFDNNTMQNCFDGYVLLNNGSIGQQGGPGNPSDNRWVGSFGNSKTLTENTSTPYLHSPIYVRSNSLFNPVGNDNQASSGLFIDTYNAPGAKITTVGSFELCISQRILTLSDKKNYVTKLVTEQQPMLDFVSGSRWAEKAEAYRWIKEDYNIAAGDTLLETFYSDASNGCFGRVDSIDNCLSGGNYLIAQSLNSLQNPVNQTEQNHKDFINVATGYDPDSLSSTDSIKLFEIAVQCPLDGGYSVYAARSMINHYYKNNIWFDDFCVVEDRLEQTDNISFQENEFQLFPNPNNGNFTVISKSSIKSGTQIHITDLSGKIIYTSKINQLSNQVELKLERLERGVYFILISMENKNYHLRFVVSK